MKKKKQENGIITLCCKSPAPFLIQPSDTYPVYTKQLIMKFACWPVWLNLVKLCNTDTGNVYSTSLTSFIVMENNIVYFLGYSTIQEKQVAGFIWLKQIAATFHLQWNLVYLTVTKTLLQISSVAKPKPKLLSHTTTRLLSKTSF